MADSAIPLLPINDALAFFRKKGLAKSYAWQDVAKAAHDFYFTVAKMMSVSLLEDVRAIIDEGIASGAAPKTLAKDLKGLLGARGWWGRQIKTDPLTGARELVQLGSDRRVRTIINTNLRTSYAAGRWSRVTRLKSTFPILVYKCVLDGRERDEHRAWNNVALLVSDPWWDSHYPPCDWGCRCRTVSMTQAQADRRDLIIGTKPAYFGTRSWRNKRTGDVTQVERGIGAGWDYHPGKAQLEGLAPPPLAAFSTDSSEAFASALPRATQGWCDAFGVNRDVGGVFTDVLGWPLPISKRWLRGRSHGEQARALRYASTIKSPSEIRLVWVKGKDGRALLMRRYVRRSAGGISVVDINPAGWRYGMTKASNSQAITTTGVQIYAAAA